uniref:uncharacterized protein LOC109973697 n=1 Tax=Monopterus albus TaxID=43700 RepID=UPI0009B3B498|nr:uncharacterized protein LOC109973697 [Monopterus albus]
MSPADEVTWGQDVSFTCSNSAELQSILKKTSSSFNKTQMSHSNSAAFSIPTVDFDKEGSYQCQYEKIISGQTFSSHLSDSVKLSVTVRLPQPSISLTSSNGGLVLSPAEVTRGYSFVITCSINCSYPDGRFFLIFSGSNIISTKSAVNHSASFDFPVAEYEHQGNYSCVYEVTLSARRFNSTETTPIIVIVKVPLLPLVSSVASGILLLLLLILLVICLVHRRRRQAKQPVVLVLSQLTDRAGNDYEDE